MIYLPDRAQLMAKLYRQGFVLDKIGKKFGLTRERVRQILRQLGVQKDEGGGALQHFIRIRAKIEKKITLNEARERRSRKNYGCSFTEVQALGPISEKRTPAHRYKQQRLSAKNRGVEWKITLPQWWKIWSESGKWSECGTGKYGMARYGDIGPYHQDNVRILSQSENSKEYQSGARAKEDRKNYLRKKSGLV